MEDVKWLSFHSGYDFGYLLKMLTDSNLPLEEPEFTSQLKLYFPNIYDVKVSPSILKRYTYYKHYMYYLKNIFIAYPHLQYLMKLCKNLRGGLQDVADTLELQRVGVQHQAGSDSLLTGMAFFKIKKVCI